ncbi:glutamate receptor ionotropic, delta-1 [Anthonomus grandis grandis]|uniref:glutamate receptor ionotropic, delta-1 n=1 Tax=Anthonomus grandis grandis TaxID=2921223 RepID=UPI002165D677|nr:glutamate receptor ionotropic, delta-1 [Anthonomus grandis grandis]
MIKSLQPYSSVTLLTDPVYGAVFHKNWFKRFGGFISYVTIIVDESEDLLAPSNETQNALIKAKDSGCQLYLILMANGLQVGRLLKFADRYRVLNTRSNYILLFDNRLFEKKLLYLWKRIINVVFIKKYSSKREWYELTTVPFPINFEDVLVPRRLDIWTHSKFRKGADFFKEKTADLKNQTLRVATFSHIPGTVKIANQTSLLRTVRANLVTSDNTSSYSGTEVEILDTVSKLMNFQCDLYEPDNADTELWGRRQVGGIYTGILGEMTAARADLALGDLYYIPYLLEIMDLSIPYNTECLTFLTPEALSDISWKTLILPFSGLMWACVMLCLLFTSGFFFILSRFHVLITEVKSTRIDRDKKGLFNIAVCSKLSNVGADMKYSMLKGLYRRPKEYGEPEGLYQFSVAENSLLYTYSMLLLVSLPKLPSGWSLRVFTGWYWLYCLLVVVSYRASLTAILSRPTPRVTIDTLQDLMDSQLTYGGCGEINTEFFKSSHDEFIQTIGRNFVIVNDSGRAVDEVAAGQFAYYENSYYLKETIAKRQLRSKESFWSNESAPLKSDRSLHIMKDCIINMPISIGLQRNSPIKPRVDKLIQRILEAGLIDKWLTDVMRKILMNRDKQDQKALMNLQKMYGGLVVLGIGYFLGVLTLFGEMLYVKNIIF